METPPTTISHAEITKLMSVYSSWFQAVDRSGQPIACSDFLRHERERCKLALSVPHSLLRNNVFFISKGTFVNTVRLSAADDYLLVNAPLENTDVIKCSGEPVHTMWYSSSLNHQQRQFTFSEARDGGHACYDYFPRAEQFCPRCFQMQSVLLDDGSFKTCSLCVAPKVPSSVVYAMAEYSADEQFIFRANSFVFRTFPIDEHGQSWFDYPSVNNTGITSLNDADYQAYRDCPQHLLPRLESPPRITMHTTDPCKPWSAQETTKYFRQWCEVMASRYFCAVDAKHKDTRKLGSVYIDYSLANVITTTSLWSIRAGALCLAVYMAYAHNIMILVLNSDSCSVQFEGSPVTVVCLTVQPQTVLRYLSRSVLLDPSDMQKNHLTQDHAPNPILRCDMCNNRTALLRSYEGMSVTQFYCDACFLFHRTQKLTTTLSGSSGKRTHGSIRWRMSWCW